MSKYALYESYEQKILKIRRVIDSILKYRYAILAAVIAICAGTVTLLSVKGNITKDFQLAERYTYGDFIDFSAKAFLANADTEYRVEGQSEWIQGEPILPGNYECRAVSKSGFGVLKFGEVHSFEITKKNLSISVEQHLTYGEAPSLVVDGLVGGDLYRKELLQYNFSDFLIADTTVTLRKDSFSIVNVDGSDRTLAYTIENVFDKEHSIVFTPRELEISYASSTKIYDGEDLSCEEIELKDELVFGDDIEFVNFSRLNRAGKVANVSDIILTDVKGRDVSSLYNVRCLEGQLEVQPRSIALLSESAEKEYDDQPLNAPHYEFVDGTELVQGDNIIVTDYAELIDVSEIENDLSFYVFKGEENVSDCYEITLNVGILKVTPRPVTVTVLGEKKYYDGIACEYEHTIGGKGFLTQHQEYVEYQAKQGEMPIGKVIDAGEYIVSVDTIIVSDSTGVDKTGNYQITFVDGVLEIERRPIGVQVEPYEKVYDGKVLTANEFKYELFPAVELATALVDSHSSVVEFSMGETDCGTYEMDFTVKVKDLSGADVSKNYSIDYNSKAQITITPRPIIIKPVDAEKPFDTKPLTSETAEVSPSSEYTLVGGHMLTIKTDGRIIEPGSMLNSVTSCEIVDGTRSVTKNYNVEYEQGVLTVVKRRIVVQPLPLNKIYDGKPLAYPDVILSNTRISIQYWQDEANVKYGDALYEGCYAYATVSFQKQIVDVGSTDAELRTYRIFDKNNVDVTSKYYEVVKKKIKASISPRPIVVSSKNVSKVYDGTPLSPSVGDCWISSGGLVLNAKINYVVSDASLWTADASIPNVIREVKINLDGRVVGYAKFDDQGNVLIGNGDAMNYVIKAKFGWLKIEEPSENTAA